MELLERGPRLHLLLRMVCTSFPAGPVLPTQQSLPFLLRKGLHFLLSRLQHGCKKEVLGSQRVKARHGALTHLAQR